MLPSCRTNLALAAAALWLASSYHSTALAAGTLATSAHGKPGVQSIHVLAFGPDGLLLVGDGRGAQVFAVQTGDTQPAGPPPTRMENIAALLAARLGGPPDSLEIVDMAVNPASGRVYFAVLRNPGRQYVILTLASDGAIDEFALDAVDYARVELSSQGGPAISRITDVAWADERLLAAAAAGEEFASKIFVARTPLVHDAPGEIHSAETYHVSHGRWETRAPMSTIIPYQANGKPYIVGAFGCTPIVKYPLDALSPGAKVQGVSVIELGSGNRPIDMFAYEKDGQEYIVANTHRFHHDRRPLGPSPYWTVRFERALLDEQQNVNENAVRRLTRDYQPATERIQMVDSFHGVMQMDRLGDHQAVVLRSVDGGRIDLEVVDLP